MEPILELVASADRERAGTGARIAVGSPLEVGLPPLEGEAFQNALQEIMQALVCETFSLKPGILVIDDIHWSDPQSVKLLLSLLPLTRDLPLVLLYSLRPDHNAPGMTVFAQGGRRTAATLHGIKQCPLSNRDTSLLVSTLLGGIEVPDDLMNRILERALGNPFFIEEVVRTLIENGTFFRDQASGRWTVSSLRDTFDIPTSLQALLSARIDQLEEMTCRTLRAVCCHRTFFLRARPCRHCGDRTRHRTSSGHSAAI